MRWFLFIMMLLLTTALAKDELKIYGMITYIAQDNRSLRLGDIDVILLNSKVEGILSVGSLAKVEGFWQGQTFYAEEVEIERPYAEVLIYQGQIQEGKLLGLEFPGLNEGAWFEIVADYRKNKLRILLVKPILEQQSRLQATVEALTEDGFIGGGVQVISSQSVTIGQPVTITGSWNGEALVENVSAQP